MPLDRWSRLQAAPFGRNTATNPDYYGGTTGASLRRLNEAYGQASRLLRRQARRGDANSALQAIKLEEDALNQGIQTGGIRRAEEYRSNILDRVDAMERGAADRERAAELNRTLVDEGDPETRRDEAGTLDRLSRSTQDATDAQYSDDVARVDPNARTTAALDILEGARSGDVDQEQRGWSAAQSLGADPSRLYRGDRNLRYRRTLDTALGAARTPAEVAALRARGTRYGIAPADFDRRANWWERQRKTA